MPRRARAGLFPRLEDANTGGSHMPEGMRSCCPAASGELRQPEVDRGRPFAACPVQPQAIGRRPHNGSGLARRNKNKMFEAGGHWGPDGASRLVSAGNSTSRVSPSLRRSLPMDNAVKFPSRKDKYQEQNHQPVTIGGSADSIYVRVSPRCLMLNALVATSGQERRFGCGIPRDEQIVDFAFGQDQSRLVRGQHRTQ
jgi:hypothetical protein